ncbi:MAG: efflux transporter periplasmic adaptor subunit [Proteobacteria bacterium]|nr:MAG: efflux transporter periplasmic adaptor subunit [Pseudomonadota bacterium]
MKLHLLYIIPALILTACQDTQKAENTSPPIRPAQIWETQAQMAEQVETYTGEVKPGQQINLSFRVPGKLVSRHVDMGDAITVGQALAQLDDEDSRLSVKQTESGLQASLGNLSAAQSNLNGAQGRLSSAQANRVAAQASLEATQTAVDTARANANAAQAAVGVAQAELQNAQLEYNRSIKLVDQGYASKAVLDRDTQRLHTAQSNLKSAQANAQAAQSQVQAAQARIKTSQAQLEVIQGEITAATANVDALSGQVKSAQAQVDSTQNQLKLAENQSAYTVLTSPESGIITQVFAEPGQVVAAGQTIMSMAKAGDYQVHIRVGEQAINQLKIGTAAKLRLWANRQTASFEGKVLEIAPNADATRTWLVKIGIKQPPADLRLGMTAEVVFHQTLDKPVIWLPATALFQQKGGKPAVWVLTDQNTVKLQAVNIERYLQDGLLISNLSAGKSVIAAGVNRLYDGQPVKPVPYDGEASPVMKP